MRAVSKSSSESSRPTRSNRSLWSWDRLKLDWEIGLHRLPAFTQRTAVLLLGVVVAAFVLIGLLVSAQRTLPQPYLHLSPSEGAPPNGAAPAGGQAGPAAGAATTTTRLPELPPSTTTPGTPAAPAARATPPPANPSSAAQPGTTTTAGATTTTRPHTTTSTSPGSTTTSTEWPPVTVTLPLLLQQALAG